MNNLSIAVKNAIDKMLSTSLKMAMAEKTILTVNSLCFEARDTNEKLTLNCGVTEALCHSALARSESDDRPVGPTHSIHR